MCLQAQAGAWEDGSWLQRRATREEVLVLLLEQDTSRESDF